MALYKKLTKLRENETADLEDTVEFTHVSLSKEIAESEKSNNEGEAAEEAMPPATLKPPEILTQPKAKEEELVDKIESRNDNLRIKAEICSPAESNNQPRCVSMIDFHSSNDQQGNQSDFSPSSGTPNSCSSKEEESPAEYEVPHSVIATSPNGSQNTSPKDIRHIQVSRPPTFLQVQFESSLRRDTLHAATSSSQPSGAVHTSVLVANSPRRDVPRNSVNNATSMNRNITPTPVHRTPTPTSTPTLRTPTPTPTLRTPTPTSTPTLRTPTPTHRTPTPTFTPTHHTPTTPHRTPTPPPNHRVPTPTLPTHGPSTAYRTPTPTHIQISPNPGQSYQSAPQFHRSSVATSSNYRESTSTTTYREQNSTSTYRDQNLGSSVQNSSSQAYGQFSPIKVRTVSTSSSSSASSSQQQANTVVRQYDIRTSTVPAAVVAAAAAATPPRPYVVMRPPPQHQPMQLSSHQSSSHAPQSRPGMLRTAAARKSTDGFHSAAQDNNYRFHNGELYCYFLVIVTGDTAIATIYILLKVFSFNSFESETPNIMNNFQCSRLMNTT